MKDGLDKWEQEWRNWDSINLDLVERRERGVWERLPQFPGSEQSQEGGKGAGSPKE